MYHTHAFPVVFSKIALNQKYQTQDMINLLETQINEINAKYQIAQINS